MAEGSGTPQGRLGWRGLSNPKRLSESQGALAFPLPQHGPAPSSRTSRSSAQASPVCSGAAPATPGLSQLLDLHVPAQSLPPAPSLPLRTRLLLTSHRHTAGLMLPGAPGSRCCFPVAQGSRWALAPQPLAQRVPLSRQRLPTPYPGVCTQCLSPVWPRRQPHPAVTLALHRPIREGKAQVLAMLGWAGPGLTKDCRPHMSLRRGRGARQILGTRVDVGPGCAVGASMGLDPSSPTLTTAASQRGCEGAVGLRVCVVCA